MRTLHRFNRHRALKQSPFCFPMRRIEKDFASENDSHQQEKELSIDLSAEIKGREHHHPDDT
jgi:hypothetical protein